MLFLFGRRLLRRGRGIRLRLSFGTRLGTCPFGGVNGGVLDDVNTVVERDCGGIGLLLLGETIVLVLVGEERSETSVLHLDGITVVVKRVDDTVRLLVTFGDDEFLALGVGDGERVVGFRNGGELAIVTDVGSETSGGDDHVLAFELSDIARQFRQVEERASIGEREGEDALVPLERGELRFPVALATASLHEGTVRTDLGVDGLFGVGVSSKDERSDTHFVLGVEGLLYFRLELLVEIGDEVVPFRLACGDAVKVLLAVGGELVVHLGRERLLQVVRNDVSEVGREEFVLLLARLFLLSGGVDVVFSIEGEDLARAFNALDTLTHDISSIFDGGDGRGVSGRSSDALVTHLIDEACLAVACLGRFGVIFSSLDGVAGEGVADGEWREAVDEIGSVVVIVGCLSVEFEESVEENDFASGFELVRGVGEGDGGGGVFDFRLSHLRSDGAFPNEFVERNEFSVIGLEGGMGHVGRTYGFMRPLFALGLLSVLLGLAVVGSVFVNDPGLGGSHGFRTERARVGTVVSDETAFKETLKHVHGLARREGEFASGFRQERRVVERRSGVAFALILANV